MGDFHQNGTITTLHNLTDRPVDALEADLVRFSARRPMGLILPSLFSELEGPALDHIVDELCRVPYLEEIVIGLDRADEAQYRHALNFFARLPQKHVRVLWNDGPRLRALDAQLAEEGLSPQEPGKGRNVWFCMGYLLASNRSQAIALHDCDIVTYDRSLLARLLYPIANPDFGFRFCKGYYARIANDKLNGRVSRLLITPLLRALKIVLGPLEFLDYLDSFRYPLAGEFSFRASVMPEFRMPSDWGLEVGVLSEMWRNYANYRICQADIADVYDHKHQDLSLDSVENGLSKMSIDITKALFRKLGTQGHVFSAEKFRTIKATYLRTALDFIEMYRCDAQVNGLKLDIHQESQAVELFAENIMKAGDLWLAHPMEIAFMPTWARVGAAFPDFSRQFLAAVDEDMREFGG